MQNNNRVICFGEVLWDILPSGAVPGGAPMNVAYHLHKQGKNPALITRIGDDGEGKELENIFARQGVCTDYFQLDKTHETGKVYAHPGANNEVTYDIVQPVAWDFIEWKENYADLVSSADYFVFGSLAARSERSRETLTTLLESATTKVLDINLRAPHYDRAILEELLYKADLLKLNLAELELLSGWYSDDIEMKDKLQELSDRFALAQIVVTLGAEGAVFFTNGNAYTHNGYPVNVMDTVGSGDAFLAGLLSRLMNGAAPEEALAYANGLGALIAGKRGACPDYSPEEVTALMK